MTDTVIFERAPTRFWPQGWWKLVDFRIGVVPLAIYVLLAGLVTFFIARDGKLASDLRTMIAVLALGGFGCAEIGKRLPVIRNLGAAAIFATFVPSYLAIAHLLPDGRALVYPNTFLGGSVLEPAFDGQVQVRYWSMCNNDGVFPYPAIGCQSDFQTKLDQSQFYTTLYRMIQLLQTGSPQTRPGYRGVRQTFR
jgi:hypothetical protein